MAPPVRYFSIDVETSGPIPGHHSLLSIGAVAVVPDGDRLVPGSSFYAELKPSHSAVVPEALAVCGLDPEELARTGRHPSDALASFAQWVRGHTPRRHRAVFVAHNAVFDWMFVAWYLHSYGIENPFGYKALDTKALAMGVLSVGWLHTSIPVLARQLELPRLDRAKQHRADYDA